MGTIAGDYNRQHSVNRRKSPAIEGDHAEAYRRVMSTWPSLMVGTAEDDLPKLFSLNKGDLSLIFIQRHRLNYFNHTHARTQSRKHVHTRAQARAHACTRTHTRKRAQAGAHTRARKQARACASVCSRLRVCACMRARVCVRVHACARACGARVHVFACALRECALRECACV